jgi:S1-C subfamily serine protease
VWWSFLSLAEAAPPEADDAKRWQQTLERITPSVVVIRMDRPRGYEGVGRGNSQATGFVIDAEQGLILTNRHVVTGGPVTAEAVFLDNEVVDLVPVYRDPIHDFGLFRYDPGALHHLVPTSLPLRPQDAAVGTQIRVVGNDSGEKLSILDGTLSRLDRPAPVYGGGYSDFDTFYIQAASATSGGSSGSPVIDLDGDVVAMNAGGKTTAATAFYLPLDRVVRAVELVKQGKPVPRGTWLTRSEHTPFDELHRLGLTEATESEVRRRDAAATGMLVLREILPGGPAADLLKIGDVLVSVGGEPVLDFVTLERLLDDAVGRDLAVEVERDGKRVTATIPVRDLHASVATSMLELGGGVLHDLSLHQARITQIPRTGVFLAESGRMWSEAGVAEGARITSVNGAEVADLAAFEAVMSTLVDDDLFVVRWHPFSRPSQQLETAVRMDRKWFPVRRCVRAVPATAPTGFTCTELPVPTGAAEDRPTPTIQPLPVDDKLGRLIQPSLVRVVTEVPFSVAGLSGLSYTGGGLVVDAARGLVLVDRDTVPISLAEVRLVLAGAIEVPAKIVLVHEQHDLALLQYDPADVGAIPVSAATFSDRVLVPGDVFPYVGIERDGNITVDEVVVDEVTPFVLRADGPPRFRQTNLDSATFEDVPSATNGVVVDKKGRVLAFHASFSYNEGREPRAVWQGIPTEVVQDVLRLADGDPDARLLGWELGTTSLTDALERGLPATWAERLVAHDPTRRSVIQVLRTEAGDPLARQVRPGDLVVSIDGEVVTRFRALEVALRGKDTVRLGVARDGEVLELEVAPRPIGTLDVTRVVTWAGVRLHTPDRSARLLGVPPARPYVAYLESGSPAGRGQLFPIQSILAVNGKDTPDLDTFVAVVKDLPAGAPVRVDTITREGERHVITVEPDEQFFPTEELVAGPTGWLRRTL